MRSTRYLKGIWPVLVVFLLVAWGVSPAIGAESSASGVLDGKTFVIKQGDKGKEAKETDTLVFNDGKFRSDG